MWGSQQLSTLGGDLVLVFFSAQFVTFFNWNSLGLIRAVEGAQVLISAGLRKVSLMLPYSITFLIGWSIMFVIWLMLGWPVGPGAPTTLAAPAG